MSKWNDTDVPIAYLITFRTYGTWLPGDERGSIDRFHNKYQGPRADPNQLRVATNSLLLKSEPVELNARGRKAVREAIKEVCEYRNWKLFAQNVRTNHAHVVVAAIVSADRVLNDLKSYSTRKLKERKLWHHEHSPCVDKGSKRKLWNDEHIYLACDYVFQPPRRRSTGI